MPLSFVSTITDAQQCAVASASSAAASTGHKLPVSEEEYRSHCMKTCHHLNSELGFPIDMAIRAVNECGPDDVTKCADWIEAKGITPHVSEMVPVEITHAGRTLEDGGTVITETAEKKQGHFHVNGFQYTLKTVGKKGTDTYHCTFNRAPCYCPVRLHYNRFSGSVNIFDKDGETPVEHTEKCKRRNMALRARNDAISSSQDTNREPPASGVNVDDEAKQWIDKFCIDHVSEIPTDIWSRLVKTMDEKYPNGWFGIHRQQALRRVYTTRGNLLGNGDLYRTIEHALYKNIPDTGQSFLQCNLTIPHPTDCTKVDRIIWFGHPTLIMLLNGRVDAFIDATFKVVPRGFYQLLVVMVKDVQTKMFVPVMYGLMTGKTKMLYFQALHFLVSATKWQFNPRRISCDFEDALISQINNQFPSPDSGRCAPDDGCDINGCLFHLKQAWRRKMLELNIPRDQISIAMQRGVLDLLCVLPPNELDSKGIHYVRSLIQRLIEEKSGNKMTLKDKTIWGVFFGYIERYWLCERKRSVWTKYRMVSYYQRYMYICIYVTHVPCFFYRMEKRNR